MKEFLNLTLLVLSSFLSSSRTVSTDPFTLFTCVVKLCFFHWLCMFDYKSAYVCPRVDQVASQYQERHGFIDLVTISQEQLQ